TPHPHTHKSILPLTKTTPHVETPSLKPLWRELSRVVQHNLQTVLGYDLLAGQRVLREQIARLMLDSGSVVTADDIIITSGCHDSMSLALMAVC
ncbi:GntR family transcriptional regulator, partial [Escherichia coli]|nr:GntR family transcriptional regulator [Escherichia coli]